MLHILTNADVMRAQFAPVGWTVDSLLRSIAEAEPHFNALIDTGACCCTTHVTRAARGPVSDDADVCVRVRACACVCVCVLDRTV